MIDANRYDLDRTRTRAEHERNPMPRVRDYVAKGWAIDAVIEQAGKDWRQYLAGEGKRNIEHA